MNGHPYTSEETLYLRQNWGRVPRREIYGRLAPHTKQSIDRKAAFLGLAGGRRTDKVSSIKIIQDPWDIRERHGIHRHVLARTSGYHPGMIQRYEKGEATPSLAILLDWCEALGCELVLVEKSAAKEDPRPDHTLPIHRICSEKCRRSDDIDPLGLIRGA